MLLASFCFTDVSGLPPLSISTVLSYEKVGKNNSSNRPPRETGCSRESKETSSPRLPPQAAQPPCNVSDPLLLHLLRVRLLRISHAFCVQLAPSFQKGLCSRLNYSPPSTIFQVAFRIRKIQEIYSQMFPCLFVDSM